MAGGSHQKENDQCEKAQRLKGKIHHASITRIADEQTYQWIQISERMKLEESKAAMRQTHQECRDTQMPPVVQQGEESTIQPRQWTDAQHDIQQEKRTCAEPADQKRFSGGIGIQQRSDSRKSREIHNQKGNENDIVDFLLPVPADRSILDAHGSFSTLAKSITA